MKSTAFFFITLSACFGGALTGCQGEKPASPAESKPALTVQAINPQWADWPQRLAAAGNVAAWQEAVIGAEVVNYRLTEVRVQVGDFVRKGQVLARIDSQTVASEVAEARAAVLEGEAILAETRANSERARQLRERGFYSPQQSTQSLTAEQTALARLQVARARLQAAELRLGRTQVVAPDDGIISARSATVGTLTQPGQELFRLIRGGRLEWRAEVTAPELSLLKPGMTAQVTAPNGTVINGTLRALAPTVDVQTRNALAYVDLPVVASQTLSNGMYVRGEFHLGNRAALTLPQSAVVLREGFAYVFRLEGGEAVSKVIQTKVATGRRQGERIEVTGLEANSRVVASGGGFLADGDSVRVVGTDVGTAKK